MRYLVASVFITISSFSFSQYTVYCSRNSNNDSLVLKFDYSEYGVLKFYQDKELKQSVSFKGSKTFSFQNISERSFGFCPLNSGLILVFYDEETNGLPCDVKEVPVL